MEPDTLFLHSTLRDSNSQAPGAVILSTPLFGASNMEYSFSVHIQLSVAEDEP